MLLSRPAKKGLERDSWVQWWGEVRWVIYVVYFSLTTGTKKSEFVRTGDSIL